MHSNKQQYKHPNRLDVYRRRMGFSLALVAELLGHQDSTTVSGYERSQRLPSLVNAFRLGIILRVPIEFIFPSLYDQLRMEIRTQEERLAQPSQQVLF